MSKEIQAALQALVQERFALRAQMAAASGPPGPGSRCVCLHVSASCLCDNVY